MSTPLEPTSGVDALLAQLDQARGIAATLLALQAGLPPTSQLADLLERCRRFLGLRDEPALRPVWRGTGADRIDPEDVAEHGATSLVPDP